jgi:hypothetical protein
MLIGMGVASTNRTDKFLAQVLLRRIAPRSLMFEGFVPTLEFGDLIFKLFCLSATFVSANAVM